MQLPGTLEEHPTAYPLVEKDLHSTKAPMEVILGQTYLPIKDYQKESGELVALPFHQ